MALNFRFFWPNISILKIQKKIRRLVTASKSPAYRTCFVVFREIVA